MTFFVDPRAVSRLGELTDRAAGDARAMRAHFERHAHLDATGEGLINLFRGGDDRNEEIVRTFLGSLADIALPNTTLAIEQVANVYARADMRAAARMDATLPDVDLSGTRVTGYGDVPPFRDAPPLFQDAAEPTDRLTEPPDYNVRMPFHPSWTDIAGAGSAGRRIIWEASNALAHLGVIDRAWDPYEVALKPLTGDWAGMATIGHVLDQEAQAARDVRENVWWAARTVDQAYRGNGADALTLHMHRLYDSLERAQATLSSMAVEYQEAAHAAYEIRHVAGFLISEAIDAATGIVLTMGATGAAASTGVGILAAPFAAAVITAYSVRLWDAFVELADIVHRLEIMGHAFAATAGDFGLISGDFDLPTLPRVPALV